MNIILATLIILGSHLQLAYSWGSEGHELISHIAESLLTDNAKSNIQYILAKQHTDIDALYNGDLKSSGSYLLPSLDGLTSKRYYKKLRKMRIEETSKLFPTSFLAAIATWADKYKNNMPWSSSLHYVNTKDGDSCSLNPGRDCSDGKCVIGAITNYTKQLSCPTFKPHKTQKTLFKRTLKKTFLTKRMPKRKIADIETDLESDFEHQVSPKTMSTNELEAKRMSQMADALKFLTHYIEDGGQPLHTCGRENGGNNVFLQFDHHQTNLHSVWDTLILEKLVAEDYGGSFDKYAQHLMKSIAIRKEASLVPLWVSTTKITSQEAFTKAGFYKAVVEWTKDTKQIDCDKVWKAYDKDPTQDFGNVYYTKMKPIIELLVMKASVRLADWLNQIFQDCPVLEFSEESIKDNVKPKASQPSKVHAAKKKVSALDDFLDPFLGNMFSSGLDSNDDE